MLFDYIAKNYDKLFSGVIGSEFGRRFKRSALFNIHIDTMANNIDAMKTTLEGDGIDLVMPFSDVFVEVEGIRGADGHTLQCGCLITNDLEGIFNAAKDLDETKNDIDAFCYAFVRVSNVFNWSFGVVENGQIGLLYSMNFYDELIRREVVSDEELEEIRTGKPGIVLQASPRFITTIADSSNWVIEKRSEKAIRRYHNAKKKHGAARSHERPIYIVAKHEELADVLQVPQEQRPKRIFRGRRAYIRTYHHEKFYKPDDGDHIGTWKGREHWITGEGKPRQTLVPHTYAKTGLPEEAQVGNLRYIVRTDLLAASPDREGCE